MEIPVIEEFSGRKAHCKEQTHLQGANPAYVRRSGSAGKLVKVLKHSERVGVSESAKHDDPAVVHGLW